MSAWIAEAVAKRLAELDPGRPVVAVHRLLVRMVNLFH